MPFAVTHVLASIILVDLYRDYFTRHKKYFTLHTVFVAGIAGLLPDIDMPLNFFLNFFNLELIHRTVTHTPLFSLIFLVPAIILWKKKRHREAIYFIVIAAGIAIHILLDYVVSADNGGIMLLYPFSNTQYALNLLKGFGADFYAGLDAIILLLWLWHEEIRHKISDYI